MSSSRDMPGALGRLGATGPVVPSGRVLAVLLSAVFVGQLDVFVVNVAAPTVQRDLAAGPGALELVVAGYAFAYAAGLITGGRLGDRYGYRRLFVLGMAAFTVASLLCALATTPGQLIAARLVQGLAAAGMLPQVLALVTACYPPAVRGRALAWYGVAGGAGSVAGQVLGGVLVAADLAGLSWRLVFLVNVPVGALAAALAARMLPDPAALRRPELDSAGAAGVALTLALVLVPLTLGRTTGWPGWTWIALAAAVPVGAATAMWQRHLARSGASPVLDLTLLRTPTFTAGLLANAAFLAYFASFTFTLTLLLQAGLGLDPLAAGLAFTPAGVAYALSALAVRPLLARHATRVLLTGCTIIAAGLLLLIAQLRASGPTTAVGWLIVAAAVMSLGNGLVLPGLIGAALVDVTPRQAGAGAGMLTTAQQFAGSAGVALIGNVYFALTSAHPSPTSTTTGITRTASIDLALVAAVAISIRRTSKTSTPLRAAGTPSR